MGEVQVVPFSSDDALAKAVAEAWVAETRKAFEAGRRHVVALSGGRIAKKLFADVVRLVNSDSRLCSKTDFFWADERCLSPDDPESNYRLADELLFQPLGIDVSQVHRINGESSPDKGAEEAEADLLRVAGKPPVLDLILLGMGEDGHVASLFPRDTATADDLDSVFLPVYNSPKPPPQRITLGHGPIARAREVWVLASGSGKQAALRESLLPKGHTPLGRVIHNRNVTRIYTDIQLP